jgi:hypothetical protein
VELNVKTVSGEKGFSMPKHLLVLFDKKEQTVAFEAISKVEYYITGLRLKSPKDIRAVYFFFCNKKLQSFQIYLL